MVTNQIDLSVLNGAYTTTSSILGNFDCSVTVHTGIDYGIDSHRNDKDTRLDEEYERRGKEQMSMNVINWYKIKDFDIINDKVMKVLFYDGKTVRVVCHEDDVFDVRRGLFLAMAKHQLKDTHTIEGIEYEATQFSYLKGYNKIVDDAIKAHDKKLKELEKQKQQEEERLRIKENKKRKHAEYLKRREEKRINLQAQAVLRGLQMYDAEQNKKKVDYDGGECENTAS